MIFSVVGNDGDQIVVAVLHRRPSIVQLFIYQSRTLRKLMSSYKQYFCGLADDGVVQRKGAGVVVSIHPSERMDGHNIEDPGVCRR